MCFASGNGGRRSEQSEQGRLTATVEVTMIVWHIFVPRCMEMDLEIARCSLGGERHGNG